MRLNTFYVYLIFLGCVASPAAYPERAVGSVEDNGAVAAQNNVPSAVQNKIAASIALAKGKPCSDNAILLNKDTCEDLRAKISNLDQSERKRLAAGSFGEAITICNGLRGITGGYKPENPSELKIVLWCKSIGIH